MPFGGTLVRVKC